MAPAMQAVDRAIWLVRNGRVADAYALLLAASAGGDGTAALELAHWRMAGLFTGVKGIALGRFSRCEPPESVPSFTVSEVLRDRLGNLGLPVVADLPFGHDGSNAALPVGAMARLDGDAGSLEILPAV